MKGKKIFSICLAGTVVFSAASCTKDVEETKAEVKIWSAPSYVKVLQNIDYSAEEAYAAYYENNSFEMFTYKNEYEAGQLIVTPTAGIKEYDIKVSDLTSANGDTLSAENMTVYNQKYVSVDKASTGHKNSLIGMMPDALLPFDTAVEYGENTVDAKLNQGIVIEIFTPETQAAGVYEGTFTLTADGEEFAVPASVTVWDATVSSENHLLSSFLVKQEKVFAAEMDASFEMYEKYYEKLLDYRICATNMPLHKVKDFDEYLSQLKKYTANEKASTIQFFDCSNSAWTAYDYDVFTEKMVAIAEESFKDGENYLKKLVYYLGMIDEPHITKTEDKVDPFLRGFAKARRNAIKQLQANKASYEADEALFDEIIDKIENFPFIVTATHNDKYDYEKMVEVRRKEAEEKGETFVEDPEEEYKITFCPPFDACHTSAQRVNNVWEDLGAWWYGCNWPQNPYPTYHLDDRLLPTRLTSWMQYNYGIVGNLYWAVNDMQDSNAYNVSEMPENVYEDLANKNCETNGEGFLVYPGKMYGLDNFVPSLRLMGIRDGMEDYEILKSTGERCEEIAAAAGYGNYDITNTFSKLYESLYQGAAIIGDHNDFSVSRQMLANFAVFANKGTVITEVLNNATDTQVKIFVADGVLKVEGQETEFVEKGNGKEYTVKIEQTKAENYLSFTLEQGAETNRFSMYVGGKKETLDLHEVSFASNTAINELSSVKNADGSVTLTMGALKQTSGESSGQKKDSQRIYLTGNAIKNSLKKSAQVNAVILMIENLGEEISLDVKYTGTRDDASLNGLYDNIKLKANATTQVTLELGTLDWTTIGAINELRLYLTCADMTKENTVTVKLMTLAH